MDNINEIYATSEKIHKIINNPEYVRYYQLYNGGVIVILILILIIPIVSIVYANYSRQTSLNQRIKSKNRLIDWEQL